ncbi:MAG: small multidrug resistance pump [Nocardioidaceae bacterium]|jgi:small multidrug resistance pump|nr:small multidrug resistance pump [Nocardioidaceae bacterium]
MILFAAIGIEVATTATLPRTHGFSSPGWTVVVVAGYATSIWLLSTTNRDIPVSVAYAVWAGLGTAGIAVVGSVFLHQPLDLVKAGAIAFIIVGVVVLNLHGAH